MDAVKRSKSIIELIDRLATAFRLDPARIAQDFFESAVGDSERDIATRLAANHVIMREHNADYADES